MIQPVETTVFRNHHDTWSYLVEAVNEDGVRVTIHGRERTKRFAAAAAARAQAAMQRCLEQLDA